MDQQLISNLKEIALLVFEIRKLRFLSSAPLDAIKNTVAKNDYFDKIQTRLCSLDHLPTEIQILLYDFFLLISRSLEGYMQIKDNPRFTLQRVYDLVRSISFLCYIWIRVFDTQSFEFLPIQNVKKLAKAQQILINNRKKISKILKKKITSQMLKDYYEQTTFLYFANIDFPILGFSSLTRNVVYFATLSKLGDPTRKYIEAQLFEGFCYWLIKEKRTPLTIISEELKIFSELGFHMEPSDAYFEKVYNETIVSQCPFKMFQFNSPRKM